MRDRWFWLRLGLGVPVATILTLLCIDEFGFFGSPKARVHTVVLPVPSASARNVELRVPSPSPPNVRRRPAAETSDGSGAAPAAEQDLGAGSKIARTRPRPTRLVEMPEETSGCIRPRADAVFFEPPPPGSRKVGLSMALHPPKFYSAAKFLEQYSACAGAWENLGVYIVFTSKEDLQMFREAMACISPDVPEDAFVPVLALVPIGGWKRPTGAANQMIAAYKKWHGLAAMMDLGDLAPEYGIMVDAELLVYDNGGEDGLRGPGCSIDGPWSLFLERIRAQEASRSFPAAKVSTTLATYEFAPGFTRSGADYDRTLLVENANFVLQQHYTGCTLPACVEIRRQIDAALFSWWTDVPWTNLQIVGELMVHLYRKPKGNMNWRELSAQINWKRFEMLGYHQWCILKEGFHIRDVTPITGEAKWGSYMEDPMPGARLAELSPIWISGEGMERVEQGVIPPMNQAVPPLIIFHADKGRERAGRERYRQLWKEVMSQIMQRKKLTQWVNDL